MTVNGRPARPGLRLVQGDTLTVTVPPPETVGIVPEDIPVQIIYEDDDILVVNKPPGLAVHPAPGHPSHTLVNALFAHLSALPDIEDSQRPGIVHRLDQFTSGVMVVARTGNAHSVLAAQFKVRTVIKVYLVLAKGHLHPLEGAIEAPIGRDPSRRERMAVVSESRGRPARTEYRVIEYVGPYSLLEVRPITGRTHQIRVHLDAIGFPVAGDRTYGVRALHLDRQFVHALRLGFRLPSTCEYAEFTAPLAPDLAEALSKIRADAQA